MPRSAVVCLSLSVAGPRPARSTSTDEGYIEREESRFPAESHGRPAPLHVRRGRSRCGPGTGPRSSSRSRSAAQDKEAVGEDSGPRGPHGTANTDRSAPSRRPADRSSASARSDRRARSSSRRCRARSTSSSGRATALSSSNVLTDGSSCARATARFARSETSGELLAESGDGTIQLDDVTGRVEARTSDGSVRITGTPSVLRARSGDGAIVLRIRRGAIMREDWMVATMTARFPSSCPTVQRRHRRRSRVGWPRRQRAHARQCDRRHAREALLSGRLGQGGHLHARTGDGPSADALLMTCQCGNRAISNEAMLIMGEAARYGLPVIDRSSPMVSIATLPHCLIAHCTASIVLSAVPAALNAS